MKRNIYIHLLTVTFTLTVSLSTAFATYVGQPSLYFNNISRPATSATINIDTKNPVNMFSIDATNKKAEEVSFSWQYVNKILENQDSNIELNIAPALLKQTIMYDKFEQVETFYLPEPVTIAFLVIGMFLLFRKRRHVAY